MLAPVLEPVDLGDNDPIMMINDLGSDVGKDSGGHVNADSTKGMNGENSPLHTSALPSALPSALSASLKVGHERHENGHLDKTHADKEPAQEVNGTHLVKGVNGLHAKGGDCIPTANASDALGDENAQANVTDQNDIDQALGHEINHEINHEIDREINNHIEHQEEIPPLMLGLSTPRSAVKIKGRPGGVSLELGEGDWDELILLLVERLEAAEGFFRGGRVLFDVGPRPLIEEHLRQVRELLEKHEMQLAVVRSTAERTLQAAMEVGISTSIEESSETLQLPHPPPLIAPDGPPNAYTPSAYAPQPEVAANRPTHFVYRGSLRSGQVLRKSESIVVIGDVNPGAQVVSGGDIMVWGRLRGIAHAGADGNRRSVVAAIDFVPTQLRISNLTAIAPEQKKARNLVLFWKKEPERRPEIARVVDGRIVVEPWDENKPNGLGAWPK